MVAGQGRVSGSLAGGLGGCCQPVGCLWPGQAWLRRVRAAVAGWPALFVACGRGIRIRRPAAVGWICCFLIVLGGAWRWLWRWATCGGR